MNQMGMNQSDQRYNISEVGIQLTSPSMTLIDWDSIEKVEIVNDVIVNKPRITFAIGLACITSVLLLIPIQKISFPFFGEDSNTVTTIAFLIIYLSLMVFGIMNIRNSLIKKPVLKLFFKDGGIEVILLNHYSRDEKSQDIITEVTKYLGKNKVIFSKEAA